jgi:methyl-accepting chemotaxis protein
MISYKNDSRKKLPYPSFISCLLRSDRVSSVDTLPTIPSEVSGLDAKAFQKMHYVKDSKGNWYYDDNGVWYYDFTVVAEGTDPELVEETKQNMEKEDYNIENDVEMEEGEETSDDDEDLDYDPENDNSHVVNQNHSSESLSEVLLGIKDFKKYMSQKFDAQDLQFKEINKRFDAQDLKFNDLNTRLDSQNASIQEMRESIQKWNDLGVSSDVFFASPCLDQDEIDGTTNPTEPKA